jgi:hypothetical protein
VAATAARRDTDVRQLDETCLEVNAVPPSHEDHAVDLSLTLDAWSPLCGRLRRIAPGPVHECEFRGWPGLASALSALARDMLCTGDRIAGEDQS